MGKTFWKEFWKAALIRAIRTAAESALTYVGTAAFFHQVNWWAAGSAALLGAVSAVLLAIVTGLPEVGGK